MSFIIPRHGLQNIPGVLGRSGVSIIPSIRFQEKRRHFRYWEPAGFPLRFASREEARSRHAPESSPLPNGRRNRHLPILAAGSGILAVVLAFIDHGHSSPADECQIKVEAASDGNMGDLPCYRLSEIREHGPKSERPWVTYGDNVYDITDWIPAHPGGEVILRAAGGSIEPYWDIFSIHKSQWVRDILEQYLVGRVHPDDLIDGRPALGSIRDPFISDPQRDGRMHFLTQKPCNAETPGPELASTFLTPNEVFYIRNHMWVPVVEEASADDHEINIELPNGDTRSYTVGELKTRFKQHAVTAVLQCSGNRRKDMTDHSKKTNGLQWTVGAISCAKWEGVRLREVLADAGLSLDDPGEDAQHVQFSGLEAYGASIPIMSALDPHGDVLLAFRMNDRPLPRDHGFPVRVIVPGHVAARCVKWVNKIVVSDEESHTSWQRKDYKCFGPNETKQNWDKYKSIQIMPVTSAITRARLKTPAAREMLTPGNTSGAIPPEMTSGPDSAVPEKDMGAQVVEVEGYAYSGGGREIQRVDISLDGGKTWDQARLIHSDAKLEQGSRSWCWKRWKYEASLAPSDANDNDDQRRWRKISLVVKATDDAYNTQPETHASIYNLRGNLATAWHRIDM